MLMALKGQVREGDTVPLTVIVENKDGKRQALEVKALARALSGAMGNDQDHQ